MCFFHLSMTSVFQPGRSSVVFFKDNEHSVAVARSTGTVIF